MKFEKGTDVSFKIVCSVGHEDKFMRKKIIHQKKCKNRLEDIQHADTS